MIGKQVGSYTIVEHLDRGGMGEVYVAHHELMNRDAVAKVLHARFSRDDEVLTRFFNEARAAARIEHPGIVDVFDVGYADDRAFVLMEKLRGETLHKRLANGPVGIPRAVTLIRQLTSVLGAAHDQGIVHRDLKPENIFVVPDRDIPGGERIKVLDFGIAKLAQGLGIGSVMTVQGSLFGTPAYMAPEQCANAAQVDHRADLYAVGAIFYELLAGDPPFGRGGLELLAANLHDDPPPLADEADVPAELERVIMRLLAKDPADRYDSCQALADALDELEERGVLGDLGVLAAPGRAGTYRGEDFISGDGDDGAAREAVRSSDTASDNDRPRASSRGVAVGAADTVADASAGHEPTEKLARRARSVSAPAAAGLTRAHKIAAAVAVAVILCASAAGAYILASSNDGEGEPAPQPVAAESPAPAAPVAPVIADIQTALAAERWEHAIVLAQRARESDGSGADTADDAAADATDAAQREQLEQLEQLELKARGEWMNSVKYQSFQGSLGKGSIQTVALLYQQLDPDSVYRERARPDYERIRDEWLAPRRTRLDELRTRRACSDLTALHQEVAALFPDQTAPFADAEAACLGRPPPPPAPHAQPGASSRGPGDHHATDIWSSSMMRVPDTDSAAKPSAPSPPANSAGTNGVARPADTALDTSVSAAISEAPSPPSGAERDRAKQRSLRPDEMRHKRAKLATRHAISDAHAKSGPHIIHIPSAHALALIRKAERDMRYCAHRFAVNGSVTLEIQINPDGRVSEARPSDRSDTPYMFEMCLRRALNKLPFPPARAFTRLPYLFVIPEGGFSTSEGMMR